jgi:hypothetical protein
MMYVYIYFKEAGVYTVGFYAPDGKWEPESDHRTAEEAAKRVHWLNGGKYPVFGSTAEQAVVRPIKDTRNGGVPWAG